MSKRGIHYLASETVKKRLAVVEAECEVAAAAVIEARKFGDLSEAAEYDAAKENLGRLTKERDMLAPVATMPTVQSSDSSSVFEEGSVVKITVYNLTQQPVGTSVEDFQKLASSVKPAFEGIVMLGGSIPTMDLLRDASLSEESAVGKFLIGKHSGNYSVKVPGGFANLTAVKLKSNEFTPDQISCTFRV